MGQEQLPAEDMATLREAVLGFYEESIGRRAGLEAAAGTLLARHLGGRQTDDALLGEIQATWEDYEAHGEQRKEQMLEDERRLWHNLAQQLTRLGADDERALRYATAPTASAPRRARSR